MTRHGIELFITVVWLAVSSATVTEGGEIRTEPVQFAAGSTRSTVEGRISGYEMVDYSLGAQAGQKMVVTMTTDSTANYFNLMAPGETDIAFFNGSVSENRFAGLLPETGDYTIRVYQMRSAARRDEVAAYSLEIEITPSDPNDATSEDVTDALVPGTEFHATGQIPCVRAASQPKVNCDFGVVREGGGKGYVEVFWPDGGTRVILFEEGSPISFDSSGADSGAEMTVDKESDLFKVRIGDQRFEIPEVVILGDNPY